MYKLGKGCLEISRQPFLYLQNPIFLTGSLAGYCQ